MREGVQKEFRGLPKGGFSNKTLCRKGHEFLDKRKLEEARQIKSEEKRKKQSQQKIASDPL
jgi:hypothetical protein